MRIGRIFRPVRPRTGRRRVCRSCGIRPWRRPCRSGRRPASTPVRACPCRSRSSPDRPGRSPWPASARNSRPGFLVADRAPARRRDVGLVGRRDTVRHRVVAHDRHHGRDGDLRIGTLHDGVDVGERRAHEAVRSAVGAGKHRQAADLPPVVEIASC